MNTTMNTTKYIFVTLLLLFTAKAKAQVQDGDTFFLSAGLDPAIASGSNFLASGDRVGAGKLNYMLQFGIENFTPGKVMPKFGLQFEQFKNINYLSGGVFGGVTFSAPTIPGTNLTAGHFWYLTTEINLISRKGIKSSIANNPNTKIDWSIGMNLGIRINKPNLCFFTLPFDAEFITNIKHRPDLTTHYNTTTLKDTVKISVYLLLVYNFKLTN